MSISDWIIVIVGIFTFACGFTSATWREREASKGVVAEVNRMHKQQWMDVIIRVNGRDVMVAPVGHLWYSSIYAGVKNGEEFSLVIPTETNRLGAIEASIYGLGAIEAMSGNGMYVDVLVRRPK